MIESYVTECITAQMPDFSMEEFATMLTAAFGLKSGPSARVQMGIGSPGAKAEIVLKLLPRARRIGTASRASEDEKRVNTSRIADGGAPRAEHAAVGARAEPAD